MYRLLVPMSMRCRSGNWVHLHPRASRHGRFGCEAAWYGNQTNSLAVGTTKPLRCAGAPCCFEVGALLFQGAEQEQDDQDHHDGAEQAGSAGVVVAPAAPVPVSDAAEQQ